MIRALFLTAWQHDRTEAMWRVFMGALFLALFGFMFAPALGAVIGRIVG